VDKIRRTMEASRYEHLNDIFTVFDSVLNAFLLLLPIVNLSKYFEATKFIFASASVVAINQHRNIHNRCNKFTFSWSLDSEK